MFLSDLIGLLIEHTDALHLRRAEQHAERQQRFIAQRQATHHDRQMFTNRLAQRFRSQRTRRTQVNADKLGATGMAGRNDLRGLHELITGVEN